MPNEIKAIAFIDYIKERLEQISPDNGYYTNPSVKEGWLQHIFSRGQTRNPSTFPMLVYRIEISNPQGGDRTDNKKMNDKIKISIDGAILTKDTDEPVKDLLRLQHDVRQSLVFPHASGKNKTLSIEVLDCPFDIPDAGDDYAFFSQRILVGVHEEYA